MQRNTLNTTTVHKLFDKQGPYTDMVMNGGVTRIRMHRDLRGVNFICMIVYFRGHYVPEVIVTQREGDNHATYSTFLPSDGRKNMLRTTYRAPKMPNDVGESLVHGKLSWK